jgi:hypothetical protein
MAKPVRSLQCQSCHGSHLSKASSEMHGMVPDPRLMNQSPQESKKAAHHAEHWSQCIIVVSELTVFAPVFWLELA